MSMHMAMLVHGRFLCRKCKGKLSAFAFLLLLASAAWFLVVFSRTCCPPLPETDVLQDWFLLTPRNPNISHVQRQRSVKDLSSLDMSASQNFTSGDLSLHNLVFGVAGSAMLWPHRREIVKLWWREGHMRGFVWLDKPVSEEPLQTLPQIKISEEVLMPVYDNAAVNRATGVRISRIVLETFRLKLPDVRWFVVCDDDTIISTKNLVHVLSKYNSSQFHYIGALSESHQQNVAFSYDMAFGGGSIAISYALAEALVGMQDECLDHHPQLRGSDDRLHACISELGVPLTREPGFHQCDIRGNPLGLLGSHPVTPFISLHHIEVIEPVFPGLSSKRGLQLLSTAMQIDPGNFLQQSFCYNQKQKQGFSFSVSIGFVVQVFPEILYPEHLQKAEVTFKAWNKKARRQEFDFDTRLSKGICKQPYLFYLDEIAALEDSTVISNYTRYTRIDDQKRFWWCHVLPPEKVLTIRVTSQPLPRSWYQVPRRQCCSITGLRDKVLDMKVSLCLPGEVIGP